MSTVGNDLRRYEKLYIRSLKARNLAESTIKAVSWKLERFFAFLEAQAIDQVDRISVQITS